MGNMGNDLVKGLDVLHVASCLIFFARFVATYRAHLVVIVVVLV
jgi:hypothetical protein